MILAHVVASPATDDLQFPLPRIRKRSPVDSRKLLRVSRLSVPPGIPGRCAVATGRERLTMNLQAPSMPMRLNEQDKNKKTFLRTMIRLGCGLGWR